MKNSIRHLVLHFTEEDFDRLSKDKEATGLTWPNYILSRCLGDKKNRAGGKE